MLGLLVVGLWLAVRGPSHGQAPNGNGPEVVPIVTRAWAHEDYGRLVFDWPWAVAYGAQMEGTTLTVMFDRRLHTTFQQVPRYLEAYISDIALGPDGQSVVATLTAEYRLRAFLLNSEDGGVKVVVDLLADGEAGPSTGLRTGPALAQAPVPPPMEPSPEAVPGDLPSPTVSGDAPFLSAEAAPEAPPADLPPSLPFAAEADPEPEAVPESSPPIGVRASSPQAAKMAALPGSGRGEEEVTPPVKADEDTPPTEPDSSPESVPTAEATPPVEEATAPESGENPPRPVGPPLQGGDEEGAGDMPAAEPTDEAVSAEGPPAETGATPEVEAKPEETAAAESDPASEPVAAPAPEAPPTPEPASAEAPPVEAAAPSEADTSSPPGRGAAEQRGGSADTSPSPSAPSGEETSSGEAEQAAASPLETTPEPAGEAPTPTPDPPSLPASVRIPVSQSRLFRLDTPAASVFVADPAIADVQLVSSGVLFVVAKAVGRTSVAVLDADSALIGEWTIKTVLDLQPVRAALEGVPALGNVTVRQLNRGVELGGTVAAIAEADLALRLTTTALPEETPVENRIRVTGKQQVNLEVQIAEVQRSVSETLGFNWEVLPDIGDGRDLGMRVGRFFFDEALGGYLVQELAEGRAATLSGSTGFAEGRTTVRGMIDALASAGLATVLARPNVTAVSGETASFFSGGEYPLPSGFEDGAIIFEYKKYGVLLDFVPTIIDSGRIMLTVRPEVSQRSDTDSLTVTGIDIPVINVRRAETTVEVGDGESIVIAGLYRDQSEAIESGLPVVKDIPLLGMLFGSQSVRSNATELIVVVTARLTTATVMPRMTDRDRQLPGRRVRGYHY